MKINLKFKAISVLMSGLQDTQKWIIYQMASGKEWPNSVTKEDLINIIAFLFKYLDWIEGTEDSIELESASNFNTQENDVTQDTEYEATKPVTSKSLDSDNHAISSSEVGPVNPASNTNELKEIDNEVTETQHLWYETDVESALDSMEQESPSNEEMEVQNETHLGEICINEPSTTMPLGNQEQQQNNSCAESTISNIIEKDQGGKEGENQYPEMDIDIAIDSEAERAAPLQDYNIDRDISFSCLKCDKKFSNEKNLAAHDFMKHLSSDDCKEKSLLVSYSKAPLKFKRDLRQNKRIHTGDKPFSCSHCDYTCSHSSKLKQHERIHTGDKPFSCYLCDYKCSSLSNLKKHERVHTGDKPFSCSQCDYKCSTSSGLKTHERIHTGDKPFSCSQCEYKCTQLGNLKSHEKIHTGVKQFSCSKCGKKFSLAHHLKTHERIHTGDKPFSCSQCEYKCSTSSSLKTHERIHTGDKPFNCGMCDKKFTQLGNLQNHERIHTGEKQFSCSQCDYKCSTSGRLKSHERIHSGAKPFSCSQCDYKCSDQSNLKSHERIHTGDKPLKCGSQ